MSEDRVRRVLEASDVDEDVLAAAEYAEEWFVDGPIDWEEFLNHMDGYVLPDGSVVDMGESLDSPAIRKIKRHIRDLRRQG